MRLEATIPGTHTLVFVRNDQMRICFDPEISGLRNNIVPSAADFLRSEWDLYVSILRKDKILFIPEHSRRNRRHARFIDSYRKYASTILVLKEELKCERGVWRRLLIRKLWEVETAPNARPTHDALVALERYETMFETSLFLLEHLEDIQYQMLCLAGRYLEKR